MPSFHTWPLSIFLSSWAVYTHTHTPPHTHTYTQICGERNLYFLFMKEGGCYKGIMMQ